VPDPGRSLIDRLAAVLPRFRLPAGTHGHSRHYMPTAKLEKGREVTTLVFDTWISIGSASLFVDWDVELPPEERALLGELAATLGYLGRAESWVDVQVLDAIESVREGTLCAPCLDNESSRPGWEQIAVLAPVTPEEYRHWRESTVSLALRELSVPAGKKPPAALLKKRAKAAAPYPDSLLDALLADTSFLQQHGWSQPPGTREVLYWRPSVPSGGALTMSTPRRAEGKCDFALLALSPPSRNMNVLPLVARTLPQAEAVHKGLVSKVGLDAGSVAPELVGRDASRAPSKGHLHAYVLPLDLDRDGHLDHILVWGRQGLGERAQAALRSFRTTYAKDVPEIHVALAALGDWGILNQLPTPWGEAIRSATGGEGATVWRSRTPFVPPRFVKKNGPNSLENQIRAELTSHGLPDAEISIGVRNERQLGFRHFVRTRRGHAPQPPVDIGFDVELRFAAPVRQPVSIGYASHFGLGGFDAVPDDA
jgi:CRISPR-associated protein Csb2